MLMESLASNCKKVRSLPRSLLPHLPQDLIFSDVLPRLPVKPLMRFECVSKAWLAMISSPNFVKSHLDFHKNDEEDKLATFSATDDDGRGPLVPEVALKYLGAHNGLLCFRGIDQKVIVCNPCTRKIKKIDEAPAWSSVGMYGFEYDEQNRDYKVVYACRTQSFNDYDVLVYSFSTMVARNDWESKTVCFNLTTNTAAILSGPKPKRCGNISICTLASCATTTVKPSMPWASAQIHQPTTLGPPRHAATPPPIEVPTTCVPPQPRELITSSSVNATTSSFQPTTSSTTTTRRRKCSIHVDANVGVNNPGAKPVWGVFPGTRPETINQNIIVVEALGTTSVHNVIVTILLVLSEPMHPDRLPGRRVVDFLDFLGARVTHDDFLVDSSETQKPVVGSQDEKEGQVDPVIIGGKKVTSLSSSSLLWRSRRVLTKSGVEIIAIHAFETHWKRIRGFTGSLDRTLEKMRSCGK
nr:F-box/kelch-repeat protein At3g23880-like [Ipomoea trifida]